MKKTYINPEMEVVKMVINQHLLDGSPGLGGEFGGGTPESNELNSELDF